MKNSIFMSGLLLLAVLISSCSLEANTNSTVKSKAQHNPQVTKIKPSSIGFVGLSDKSVIHSLETTCAKSREPADKCLYFKNISNTEFTNVNVSDISNSYSKLTLKTKLYQGVKIEGDFDRETLILTTYVNGEPVDKIDLYNYEFNDFAYNEKVFYLNEKLELWILDSIIYEGILNVRSWNKYVINPNTGKIIRDPNISYESIHSEEMKKMDMSGCYRCSDSPEYTEQHQYDELK